MNNGFMELAKARYSVRSFSDKPVEKDKIDLILEAARIAPSAKNLQPIVIYIISGKDSVEKLKTVCPCTYGAQLVFAIGCDKDQMWSSDEDPSFNSAYIDTSIALTHMVLEATELGLGSCWVCRFSQKGISDLFDIPENIVITSLLPVGYSADGCTPSPRHTAYKEIGDIVKYIE